MAHFLENDEKIRQGIFTENLTAEIFTDYIFTLFLSILLEKQNEKESFLEFVKNYLYYFQKNLVNLNLHHLHK